MTYHENKMVEHGPHALQQMRMEVVSAFASKGIY